MIIIYRADNGEIQRTISAPDDEAERNLLPGESFILSDVAPDFVTQYVNAGSLAPRPPSPVTWDASLATLHNLPSPTLIIVQSPVSRQVFYSDLTDQALTFQYPGQYTLWVRAFPYRDAKFTYTKA